MARVVLSNATVAKPADGSFKHTAMRQRSSPQATGLSALSRGDGDASDRQGSRHPSQESLSLVGTSFAKHSQQARHRPKPAPPSKSMNSARSSLKKSQCWLWLAVGFIFGKVLGFVCGRRTIKTGKVPWQQIKHLPTMGYGMDMLKAYENFTTRQALRVKDLHHTNRII